MAEEVAVSPPFEISVAYSEDMVRVAARGFLVRFEFQGKMIVYALFMLVGGVHIQLISGDWFLSIAFWCMIPVAFVLRCLVGLWSTRRSFAEFRLFQNPIIVWRFSDEKVACQSELGLMEAPWRFFNAIWCFPEVWTFNFGNSNYTILPIAPISEEIKQFIVGKIKANRGKVKDYRAARLLKRPNLGSLKVI
jgi:hypothetical protein